jgi:hypothetical protein
MKHFENAWSEEAREDARFDLCPQRDASHSRQTLAHNVTPHTAGRPWPTTWRLTQPADLGPQRDASHSRQTLAHNMTPHTASRPWPTTWRLTQPAEQRRGSDRGTAESWLGTFRLFGPLKRHLSDELFLNYVTAAVSTWSQALDQDLCAKAFSAPVSRWEKFFSSCSYYVEK